MLGEEGRFVPGGQDLKALGMLSLVFCHPKWPAPSDDGMVLLQGLEL